MTCTILLFATDDDLQALSRAQCVISNRRLKLVIADFLLVDSCMHALIYRLITQGAGITKC